MTTAKVNHSSHISVPSPVPPTAMPLLSPSALLQASLSQTPPIRPYSSRHPTQIRPIALNTSSLTHTNGSSVVKLGSSTVVCGIRAEILPVSDIPHYRASTVSRQARRPTREQIDSNTAWQTEDYSPIVHNNLLVPNLELATSSPLFPPNQPPSTTAQSLSQRLLSLLLTTKTIPVSDLEIRYTPPDLDNSAIDPDDPAYIEVEQNQLKAYWVLYIDCVCLSYDGVSSVLDATWLAVFAALQDTVLPKAEWDQDLARVFCDADVKNATRLGLRGCPVPLSWGIFEFDEHLEFSKAQKSKDTNILLVDLDSLEEECCEERGCVVVDCEGANMEIVRIEKSGGKGHLDLGELKEILSLAQQRHNEWNKLLAKQVGRGAG